jgi:hypothetical protein
MHWTSLLGNDFSVDKRGGERGCAVQSMCCQAKLIFYDRITMKRRKGFGTLRLCYLVEIIEVVDARAEPRMTAGKGADDSQ